MFLSHTILYCRNMYNRPCPNAIGLMRKQTKLQDAFSKYSPIGQRILLTIVRCSSWDVIWILADSFQPAVSRNLLETIFWIYISMCFRRWIKTTSGVDDNNNMRTGDHCCIIIDDCHCVFGLRLQKIEYYQRFVNISRYIWNMRLPIIERSWELNVTKVNIKIRCTDPWLEKDSAVSTSSSIVKRRTKSRKFHRANVWQSMLMKVTSTPWNSLKRVIVLLKWTSEHEQKSEGNKHLRVRGCDKWLRLCGMYGRRDHCYSHNSILVKWWT